MHLIRLRGPWECETLGRRVVMPCDWGAELGSEFRGVVEFRRAFGRPTSLEPHERVFLVVGALPCPAHLSLNGESLGEMAPLTAAEFEVTDRLLARNELLLSAQAAGALPCSVLIGEVGLEIRG